MRLSPNNAFTLISVTESEYKGEVLEASNVIVWFAQLSVLIGIP